MRAYHRKAVPEGIYADSTPVSDPPAWTVGRVDLTHDAGGPTASTAAVAGP